VTPTPAEVAHAAEVLRAGGLVAFPTETVYGLGAHAGQPAALARVFAVKGRPPDHPLIVHLAPGLDLDDWALDVPPAARALAAACWPGPLTMVLRRHPRVDPVATGGRDTVGLRVPAHPVAQDLLARVGGGVAAPSANRFGRVSPTTAAHVRADLGEDVDVVLDGGPCAVGVESTIVDLTVEDPVVLRHGGVPVEVLEAVLGRPVGRHAAGPARAPGMLAAHYAPSARVVLCADADQAAARAGRERAAGQRVRVLDPRVDATAWAHALYGWLRDADVADLDVLVVVPPPEEGLGVAVADRLRRAAVGSGGEVSPPTG